MKAHKGFEMSSSEQEVNLIKIFFNHRWMLTLGVIGRLKSMKQTLQILAQIKPFLKVRKICS